MVAFLYFLSFAVVTFASIAFAPAFGAIGSFFTLMLPLTALGVGFVIQQSRIATFDDKYGDPDAVKLPGDPSRDDDDSTMLIVMFLTGVFVGGLVAMFASAYGTIGFAVASVVVIGRPAILPLSDVKPSDIASINWKARVMYLNAPASDYRETIIDWVGSRYVGAVAFKQNDRKAIKNGGPLRVERVWNGLLKAGRTGTPSGEKWLAGGVISYDMKKAGHLSIVDNKIVQAAKKERATPRPYRGLDLHATVFIRCNGWTIVFRPDAEGVTDLMVGESLESRGLATL